MGLSQTTRLNGRVLAISAAILFYGPAAVAQDAVVQLEPVYTDVEFESPVGIRHANDGSDRMYVVEHGGRVKVVAMDTAGAEASIFLDLSKRLATDPPGELYTIEFHPNYRKKGHFFVRYKLEDPHRTVLSRFSRSARDSLKADLESETVLLEIETPGNVLNHHGGDLVFGPDGYLYATMGDGGTILDEAGNAQDRKKLLGKVLRLDVDRSSGGRAYGIPPDNPFVGNDSGWREEIFAYGFRNPWRMSIDTVTGEIWLGDVGEATWEEVNLVQAGRNYGWPIMEGPECLGGGEACNQTDLVPPVYAYGRDDGMSITGGYVYRGTRIPELYGKYVFADFGSWNFWTLDATEPEIGASLLLDRTYLNLSSFGVDSEGELYAVPYFGGAIYRFGRVSTSPSRPEPRLPFASILDPPYPNPAVAEVRIAFQAEHAAHARLALYDMLGRRITTIFEGVVPPSVRREVAFDTNGLAAGVYVCRMEIGDEIQVRKLVVAR